MGMKIRKRTSRKDRTADKSTPETPDVASLQEDVAALSESVAELTKGIETLTTGHRTVLDTMKDLQEAKKGREKTAAENQEMNERQLKEATAINERNKRTVPVFESAEKVSAHYLFKGINENTPPEIAQEQVLKALYSPTDDELTREFQRHVNRVKVAKEMLDNSRDGTGTYKNTRWYKDYENFLEATEIDKILTLANATTDFVPEGWSMEILYRFYQELKIASAFMDFEMPHSPYTWPLIGRGKARRRALPTASGRGTAANEYPEDSSDTNKVTFEAETLSVRQDLLEEFVEDSADMLMDMLTDVIIPETMAQGIESALVNGDTRPHTVATNRDQGHEATDIETAWDGLRRIALTLGRTVDIGNASGVFDFGDFADVVAAGGKYLIMPDDCCWVFENTTYNRSLKFDEVETYDKNPMPTNINGVVNMILGRPVVISGEWPLTHTDGYVSGTDTNNTKGGFACFNKKLFAIGNKRGERVQQVYDALTGFFYVVATCRKDFQALEEVSTSSNPDFAPVSLAINVPL